MILHGQEIIRLLEHCRLPVRRTLRHPGIPTTMFRGWYERCQEGRLEALADHPSRPDRAWNRIPDTASGRITGVALAEPELSPREPAARLTKAAR